MNTYSIYNSATGEIIGFISDTKLHQSDIKNGQAGTVGVSDHSTQYVKNGTITDRPEMQLGLSAQSVTIDEVLRITGIPIGATLTGPGIDANGEPTIVSIQIDDGVVEWSCSLPGNYPLMFSLFPYLDEVVDATVTL